jgi:putative flippase GtrA
MTFSGKIFTSLLKKYDKTFGKYFPVRFIVFLIVGGINTIFGYGIFALCLYLKFHYALASVTATILGVLFNFKTSGVIVFKNNDNSLIWKFFLVYGISFCIGIVYLWVMNQFSISNYISGAIWLIPGAIVAYSLQRLIVFKSPKKSLNLISDINSV